MEGNKPQEINYASMIEARKEIITSGINSLWIVPSEKVDSVTKIIETDKVIRDRSAYISAGLVSAAVSFGIKSGILNNPFHESGDIKFAMALGVSGLFIYMVGNTFADHKLGNSFSAINPALEDIKLETILRRGTGNSQEKYHAIREFDDKIAESKGIPSVFIGLSSAPILTGIEYLFNEGESNHGIGMALCIFGLILPCLAFTVHKLSIADAYYEGKTFMNKPEDKSS